MDRTGHGETDVKGGDGYDNFCDGLCLSQDADAVPGDAHLGLRSSDRPLPSTHRSPQETTRFEGSTYVDLPKIRRLSLIDTEKLHLSDARRTGCIPLAGPNYCAYFLFLFLHSHVGSSNILFRVTFVCPLIYTKEIRLKR